MYLSDYLRERTGQLLRFTSVWLFWLGKTNTLVGYCILWIYVFELTTKQHCQSQNFKILFSSFFFFFGGGVFGVDCR